VAPTFFAAATATSLTASTITVNGIANLQSNLYVPAIGTSSILTSTITVNGIANLQSNLYVPAIGTSSILTSTITVNGIANLQSNLYVPAIGTSSILTSTITVNGIAQFGGPGIVAIGNVSTPFTGNGSVLKLRSDVFTTDTYQIEYNNQVSTATDTLAIRFVGNSDSFAQRYFSFGNYTDNNRSNAWNTAMSIGSQNGRMGLGIAAPGVQLDLSTDGARKLTTTAWTTGSDERIKKHISSANVELCYSTLKQINLKYFEWDRSIPQLSTVQDRHSIGFIAQEIRPFFPNAVTFDSNMGLSDFHSLNVDQLYKLNFGATQHLGRIVETQSTQIAALLTQVSTMNDAVSYIPQLTSTLKGLGH